MRKHTIKDVEKKRSHKKILAYEKRGTSKRYTYYGLPENCDTVFFSGCTLTGTRPKTTLKLIHLLQQNIPTLGVVLDCCTKPSYDLGYTAYFHQMFDELNQFLDGHNISKVLVACPNCYKTFQRYGKNIAVQTVYEYLAQSTLIPFIINPAKTISLHDPCPMRFEDSILQSVRDLLSAMGYTVSEMHHTKKNTLCCGEGVAGSIVTEGLATKWRQIRINELNGNPLITYCAGCAGLLSKSFPTHHLLDLLFEPEKTLRGKSDISTAPFTYLNRLILKHKIKKTIAFQISRERTFEAVRE